jgi:hypothetical protein
MDAPKNLRLLVQCCTWSDRLWSQPKISVNRIKQPNNLLFERLCRRQHQCEPFLLKIENRKKAVELSRENKICRAKKIQTLKKTLSKFCVLVCFCKFFVIYFRLFDRVSSSTSFSMRALFCEQIIMLS